MMSFDFPTAPHCGIAFGAPLDVALSELEKAAQTLKEAADKTPEKPDSFGQRLCQAVKRKLGSRGSGPKAQGGFGQKLSDAVKRKLADRPQRSYYRRLKPRRAGKSD
jgi:hypothetical protein